MEGIPDGYGEIDLLMSGLDEQNRSKLIIIELKQWESASKTNKDGLVRTRFSGGEGDTSNPSSYEAGSHAELLRNFKIIWQEVVDLGYSSNLK